MSKTLVILNPISGNGEGSRQWPAIETALRAGGLDFDLTRTEAADSASKIALSARQSGYETLIAVGGDGTIHQVVNGLMTAYDTEPTVRLGFIPVGSGNDLIKTFGMKPVWQSGVELVVRGTSRPIDIGRVTAAELGAKPRSEYFINSLTTGFGARVAMKAHEIPLLAGNAMYLVAVLKGLLDYSVPQMRIDLDGNIVEQRSTMVAIGNGRCVGGGFWMAPQAQIDDGQLDVIVTKGLDRIGVLTLLPMVMKGTHIGDPRIDLTRAHCITIESPDALTVEADGEIPFVATHHIQVEILPRRLVVLA